MWEYGYAKTPPVLTPDECADLAALYGDEGRFRSRIDMARYRFGVGEYKYFAAPLPPLVEALRERAYPPLAAIANQWQAALGDPHLFPADLPALLRRCRQHGQTKPAPPMLPHEAAGYNRPHQGPHRDARAPPPPTGYLPRPRPRRPGRPPPP